MSITIWLGKGQYYGPVRCVEEASSHPQLLFIAYLQYSHSSESISGATVDVPISSPYVHTSIPLYYFVFLCAKHWNIALKIHPSPNKPWFNWNSPEIASTSQCWNANLQDSMSRPTWKFWRDQTCLNDWCAVASRWIYWILRAGTSFPKNVIKTAILEFQYCKLTFPKLTILPEIRGLGKQPSFWKQHFPDSYGFIAGDIEILRFGMSSISGIHWAFVAEVFSKFLMRDVGESPVSLIHSCHLFDGSFNHF